MRTYVQYADIGTTLHKAKAVNNMTHTQLLNLLIDRYGLKSYLEIGVQTAEQNYNKIKLPYRNKVGVDPALTLKDNIVPVTSDTFFKHQTDTFDLIFIDGLHHADQVQRDFENSLRCLNEGGFIVLHDTCPDEEVCTYVPRTTRKWFGDVYKFAMQLGRYNGLNFVTFDIDCGITVCWKQRPLDNDTIAMWEMDFEKYLQYKHSALQISDISNIDKVLPVRKEVVR